MKVSKFVYLETFKSCIDFQFRNMHFFSFSFFILKLFHLAVYTQYCCRTGYCLETTLYTVIVEILHLA